MARPRRKTSASTRMMPTSSTGRESVEAAATAFDFDRAEAETEELLIKTTGEADEA